MKSKLTVESRTEKVIINELKIEAIKEINKIGFEEASEKLSLSHARLRRLLWPREWKIAEAIRIAEALNLSALKKMLRVLDKTDGRPESEEGDYPDWEI